MPFRSVPTAGGKGLVWSPASDVYVLPALTAVKLISAGPLTNSPTNPNASSRIRWRSPPPPNVRRS